MTKRPEMQPNSPQPNQPSAGEAESAAATPPAKRTPLSQFLVYGLNIVVRMQKQEEIKVAVQCPRGQPIQYGEVVATGDGFDPQASMFRTMPPYGAVVAFEETTEGIEGHYLFVGDDEFRVLHLDVITIAFPPK